MSGAGFRVDRLGPCPQRNWDWRAAANFICGGAGSGLLLWAPFAFPAGGAVQGRAAIALALVLVGFGLTCVWFEIGRPWRALNVFRHAASSWMTREAVVAPLLFASGLLALWNGSEGVALRAAGLLGLAFLYSQARMLAADRGIPAWRHRRCLPMIVSTGLAEGAGLLTVVAASGAEDSAGHAPAALLLAAFALLRIVAWRRYLAALERDGAPAGAIRALRAIDRGVVWLGGALAAALAVAGLAAGLPVVTAAGGVAAAAAGAWLKYTLVCRAAFTQGFALPKLPVRGGAEGLAPGVR
ncbi:MAG TPA: DmsC/YnfH family molybdoenzyme membrane anchor subunit [Burkholderiaceae bacterium]